MTGGKNYDSKPVESVGVREPPSDAKINSETAELEFDRFAAAWDLDTEVELMNMEDRESFEAQKRKIVRKIMSGSAVVDLEGNITYTLSGETFGLFEIHFKLPSGHAYLNMDSFKDRQSIHKLNAFMGSIINQNPKIFASMSAVDVKFCQAVSLLFLGS